MLRKTPPSLVRHTSPSLLFPDYNRQGDKGLRFSDDLSIKELLVVLRHEYWSRFVLEWGFDTELYVMFYFVSLSLNSD